MKHQILSEGIWHRSITFTIGTSQTLFKGLDTGCGLCSMSSFTRIAELEKNKIDEVIKYLNLNIFKLLKEDGVGAVICTLGDNFINNNLIIYFLIQLKFKTMYTYPNLRHGGNYQQTIYLKNLSDD